MKNKDSIDPDTQKKQSVRRQVMQELSTQQKWPLGSWAYDGRKNIYSPSRFLPQRSQYEVDFRPTSTTLPHIRIHSSPGQPSFTVAVCQATSPTLHCRLFID